MSIQEVDFGRIDAESETNLADYFVDTGVLGRLRTGKKHYVVGRKGAGKTAIFKYANSAKLSRATVPMDFTEYSWDAHKLIQEDGVARDSSFIASWRFTIYVNFLRYWSANASGALKKDSKKYLEKLYGKENVSPLGALVDGVKRIRKFELPNAGDLGGLGAIELDERPEGPLLARSLSRWNELIGKYVLEHFWECPVTLLLDGLDDGWDSSEDSKMLLAGALKSARDVNLKLLKPREMVPVLTFLRSDIYNELRFNDKNKINDDVEFLEWTTERLAEVAETRIAKSLECPIEDAWSRVFSSEPMRQQASIKSYMLKRTMLRPRDMIAFCLKCQTSAESHGRSLVETNDVYTAEGEYSRHIFSELEEEMHKQLRQTPEMMQALRDVGLTRFNRQTWLQTLRARDASFSESKATDWLQYLFDFAILGVERKGGHQRGTTLLFIYNDRLLKPTFDDGDMIVHPSLIKHLSLKEPRKIKAAMVSANRSG